MALLRWTSSINKRSALEAGRTATANQQWPLTRSVVVATDRLQFHIHNISTHLYLYLYIYRGFLNNNCSFTGWKEVPACNRDRPVMLVPLSASCRLRWDQNPCWVQQNGETRTTECKETKKYKRVCKPDTNPTFGPNFTESLTIRSLGFNRGRWKLFEKRFGSDGDVRNGAVFSFFPMHHR